jgi:membrane-associated phospholipid phosphatase
MRAERSFVSIALGFASRHRWSLPLATLATVCFARLATELRERELGPFDAATALVVTNLRGRLDRPMLWLTRFGQGTSLAILTSVAVAVLLAYKRRRDAAFVVTVGVGIWGLIVALKIVFQRERPEASALYVLHTPGSFSFPSGHAMGTTAVVLGLLIVARVRFGRGWYFVPMAVLGSGLVTGVAASRVYFGVHFMSDVLGGVLAGAGWVSGLTGFFYPRVLPGERATLPPPVPDE